MAWKCGKHPGKAIPNGKKCPTKGCSTVGHGWTATEIKEQETALKEAEA